jgi:hypothetical protein
MGKPAVPGLWNGVDALLVETLFEQCVDLVPE